MPLCGWQNADTHALIFCSFSLPLSVYAMLSLFRLFLSSFPTTKCSNAIATADMCDSLCANIFTIEKYNLIIQSISQSITLSPPVPPYLCDNRLLQQNLRIQGESPKFSYSAEDKLIKENRHVSEGAVALNFIYGHQNWHGSEMFIVWWFHSDGLFERAKTMTIIIRCPPPPLHAHESKTYWFHIWCGSIPWWSHHSHRGQICGPTRWWLFRWSSLNPGRTQGG